MLLCGCSTQQPNSVPQSSSVVGNSSVEQSSKSDNSVQAETNSGTISSETLNSGLNDTDITDEETNYFENHSFFTEDSSKSDEYNKAIKCYNDYLIEGLKNWYYDEDFNYGEDIITGYCLYDFESDGIPELLVRYGSPILQEAKVCTYLNGDIVSSWVGDMRILENGIIGYYRVGTYHRYTFCKHNADGNFERILKLEEVHMGSETENEFYIDEVQVSKEEYFRLADKWISEYEKAHYPSYRYIWEEIGC